MAKFRLGEGESLVESVHVHTVVDGVLRPARVILTDRRIVLIPERRPSLWKKLNVFSMFTTTRLAPTMLPDLLSSSADVISHQIAREEFASATVLESSELEVRSKGVGYGMTHFEFRTPDLVGWATRLEQWAADAPRA